MTFCADCVKGFVHEGIPQGKVEEIGGINTYVAIPTEDDYPKDTVILFLTDVFGLELVNNKLLADDFARNGWKVVVPDLFNGDPVPKDAHNPGAAYDVMKWLHSGHTPADVRPIIDKVVAALKEEGVTKFLVTGYCFGARFVFDLAFDKVIDVAVVSHPSLLELPQDLEKYLTTAEAPLLINSASNDRRLNLEHQANADRILGNGNFAPGYKREHFEGCDHGFAVRGDLTNPQVKAGKEGAFRATVTWFKNNSKA
ncbi:dienelactone hydrolase endo-1,3,1,4-beta-D-glucanase [Ephemerocybe angulata]|uniref:Dienelactone hydrolase endo-1,3,1,4-beta-D-glucanase n=1 Tax=Ephemerocybe angulata TaxID=980116 RepID=A0A8H6H9L2_9AGAR|nr:dienelactone hydrolase endo-1,3,1,4-beta-D-glucanase [Tulosesus angulatus]